MKKPTPFLWLRVLLMLGLAAAVYGGTDDDDTRAGASPAAVQHGADGARQAAGDKDDLKGGKQDDDDDAKPAKNAGEKDKDDGASAPLSLTLAQQQAVGIRIDHPLPVSSAPQMDGYVSVLDPALLVSDLGHVESSDAAAAAASAEAQRTQRLYHDDAQASLRSSQAAQAQAAESAAQARGASIGFDLQWGPVAHLSSQARRMLLEDLTAGRAVLLRADLPGYHVGTQIDSRALVEIDGINIVASVLGPLPRTSIAAQSAGWLLEIARAPKGLGPGARGIVHLRANTDLKGLLVPAGALLYSEKGAYVYRQEAAGQDTFHYTAVPVKPLSRVGNAWLVDGLGRADPVVTQGAAVLWSLQGISSFSAAEEDHD
jgi:hypothetical protein